MRGAFRELLIANTNKMQIDTRALTWITCAHSAVI